MKSCKNLLPTILTLLIISIQLTNAAPAKRVPHIGYLYPAGGQQSTVFQINAGGQFLRGITNVYISGEGVTASVTRHIMPLKKKEERAVRKHFREMQRQHRAIKQGKEPPATPEDMPERPDHPWLAGMDEMDMQELKKLQNKIFDPKKQPNAQIGEVVEIKVFIANNAKPGDRELRLGTRLGLTNPLRFQVGEIAEISEQEPNNLKPATNLILKTSILLNGQITPGDVDQFILKAKKDQRILLDVNARRLIPYLADAVPGWFQAIITMYDSEGKEVAFADDYRFHPDPHLFINIPADDEYIVEIRDAIYRGREDFVYRIAITDIDPDAKDIFSETKNDKDITQEQEPNNRQKNAQQIKLPFLVEGQISSPGDVDFFQFKGNSNEEVVAEIFARRKLDSPVDSLLKLTDSDGNTIAWNDDFMEKSGHLHLGEGLLTHYADSYLRARLPKDGIYFISMEDAQGHGAKEFIYRLRISPPQSDFSLRVTPSSISLPAGHTTTIDIHVLRQDNFNGIINMALFDAPEGFALSGSTIPEGKEHIRMTLTAPSKAPEEPIALQMEGIAQVNGKEVRHLAVPADDTMQAFLWRHIVSAQDLLVAVTSRKRPVPPIKLITSTPIKIIPGKTTKIKWKVSKPAMLKRVQWELNSPLAGITLTKTEIKENILILSLRAEGENITAGMQDNLIFEAFAKWTSGGKNKKNLKNKKTDTNKPTDKKKKTGKKRSGRTSLGYLPAIPMEIITP